MFKKYLVKAINNPRRAITFIKGKFYSFFVKKYFSSSKQNRSDSDDGLYVRSIKAISHAIIIIVDSTGIDAPHFANVPRLFPLTLSHAWLNFSMFSSCLKYRRGGRAMEKGLR